MPEDDAMAKDSRNGSSGEAIDATERTSLDALIRGRARGVIAAIVEEELEARWGPRSRRGWARLAKATGTGLASEH